MKSSSSLVPTISIEEQLEELEQLCDTAPVGLSLMDCDFRYLRLNKWLAEMSGKPVSAHIGRTIREVLPEIATSVEARLRRVIETGEPVLGVEMHGLTPAQPGVERDWSISSFPVRSEKGEVRAIASVIEEVTERKQTERALQKAHDELEETLQDIVGDASRAGGMIERQRRFLRKDQFDRSQLDINEVIQGVESLARTEALENKVTLVFDLAADSLTTWADRIQLEQVLLNLIRNGSEAMKSSSGENGELVVGTRLLETNTIIISICDSGPSLDRQSFDRIFEPFYTTKPNGLGMGLPICRSIVEAHGGRMWAVQSPEQGITVYFTLPYREGELSG